MDKKSVPDVRAYVASAYDLRSEADEPIFPEGDHGLEFLAESAVDETYGCFCDHCISGLQLPDLTSVANGSLQLPTVAMTSTMLMHAQEEKSFTFTPAQAVPQKSPHRQSPNQKEVLSPALAHPSLPERPSSPAGSLSSRQKKKDNFYERRAKGQYPLHERLLDEGTSASTKSGLKRKIRMPDRRSAPPKRHKQAFNTAKVYPSAFSQDDVKGTKPAWIGRSVKQAGINYPDLSGNERQDGSQLHPDVDAYVRKLVEEAGYQYIVNSDGVQVITDKDGNVIALKPHQPKGWDNTTAGVVRAINRLQEGGFCYAKSENSHAVQRDSNINHCINLGYSIGNGQTEPMELCHRVKRNKELLVDFEKDEYVRMWVNHVIECMKTFFPQHFRLYTEARHRLELIDRLVQSIFKESPFPTMSINDGPHATAEVHRDAHNLIWGLCVLGIFGSFNERTSGQLICHEAAFIMELKHGDVFFFPSGGISHENAPLRKGETRYSLVQYMAGGHLRWIWQGHRLAAKQGQPGYLLPKEVKEQGQVRWKKGWEMFPHILDYERAKETGYLEFDRAKLSEDIDFFIPRKTQ